MDPGTALGVASLVYDVTKDLYDYYRAWKDCDKDVEDLRLQLLWLHNAFVVVKKCLRNPELPHDHRDLVCQAMQNCEVAANKLSKKLEKIKSEARPKDMIETIKAQGRRACYPFKKGTVGAIVDNVESCRDALNLAVNVLHLGIFNDISRDLQALDKKLVDGIDTIDAAVRALSLDIRKLQEATVSFQKATTATQDKAALRAISEWFSETDYSLQLQDFAKSHTKGTGQWFLTSAKFDAWSEGAEKTLYCPGDPGTGKTIMAASVVNYLLDVKDNADTAVLYAFCNHNRQKEQDVPHFLGALLRQLTHARTYAPQAVEQIYKRHVSRRTRPQEDELVAAMTSVVSECGRVYVIIDALDECNSHSRRNLLPILLQMQEKADVRLLVTSRPLPEVQDQITAKHILVVRASDEDIKSHLESRMDDLQVCIQDDKALQSKLVTTIVTAVDGIFLLANLHMESLTDKFTSRAVKTALEKLPTGSDAYDSAYEMAMKRIQDKPKAARELAEKTLMWIACARTPLTSDQLRHALSVQASSLAPDEDDMVSISGLISVCTGMITQDEQSGIVRLIHYTAQEYFGRTRARWFPDADAALALGCIRYLWFDEFSSGPCLSRVHMVERLRAFPFFEYAARHWGLHSYDSQADSGKAGVVQPELEVVEFLQSRKSVMSSAQVLLIEEHQLYRTAESAIGGLHVAAYFGLVSAASYLSSVGYQYDETDHYGRTALWYAARQGQIDMCQFLIDNGASINAGLERRGNALYAASRRGHQNIVQMLLAKGADVNAAGEDSVTALYAASAAGHQTIVQMLLAKGADVITAGGFLDSAFYAASRRGHQTIVQMLLANGADVNAAGGILDSALYAASRRGYQTIVQMLLANGADVNAAREDSSTALYAASGGGHQTIVQMLLDKGADVNMKGVGNSTALHAASLGRHELIVRMLLENGADINAKDQYGRTALQRLIAEPYRERSTKSKEAIANMLIAAGADPEHYTAGIAADEIDPDRRTLMI